MSNVILFLSELVLSLGISVAMILWFTPPLKIVLAETCGTPERGAFWVRYTQFMLLVTPLLTVILFSEATDSQCLNVLKFMHDTLFRVLLGIVLALLVTGQVIWRAIRPMDRGATAPAMHNDATERG